MISQSREHSLLQAIAEDPSRKVFIPQGRSYLANPPGMTFWQAVSSWAFTLDHKRIGVMYLCGVMSAFLLGGIFAGAVRLELWNGTPGLFHDNVQQAQDFYNQMFTLHGAVMTFLFIIPSIPAALGNIFLPMMLGAKDVAFPRMNLASFHLWCIGAVFFLITLLTSGLDTGWTFYTPYSTSTQTSVIFATMGVFILGFSSIFTGLNFVVTVNTMRPKGMTWFKMPLFMWGIYSTAIIQVLATPVLAITLVLLMCERLMGIGIFDPALGGDPVLYQHFFWFYSHPAVYIMILPGMAIISEVIPVHSRKHIFGYTFIAYSSVAIALLGFLVWGHHMFTSTESKLAAVIFSALTFTVSIPSAIKVFNWLTTMYKGSIHLTTPMCYALAFIVQFTIGGLTGLFLGTLATDIHLHDTYFVVAHFHYVMMGSTLIAFLAGLFHWWPKMFGKMYSELWGRIACLLVFIGFNTTFFPQFILGTRGMPRRYAAYKPEFQFLHQLSTSGYVILGVGFSLAAAVLIYSLFRGKKAPDNPWGAATLEWKCCSPPTTANFEIQPWVGSPYVYDDFVYDPDEGGYVEVLPDLHRSGKTADAPAAPVTH
ncbi:cytochrome c oxidase subunit I [Botrimarina mediterranea]|uniref:Cytochrome c oxidase subunit 1 n=1 Tax=Botrimarina mediterranea TaxID=2528022 RepID=A0A518KET1_9BACT|nr:cbb3-type cytochrome c oxidase subunit I [Botrimarina mediterranea]QDV76299.1 Cytochrome c oxidase subunit 1 [Botrimarina mediterranea]QDV80897.1 Cytochrome c oxidase subunit 1 [Planctomycetes bacterium K2D]